MRLRPSGRGRPPRDGGVLTRKRDLRTGQPVWTTSRRPPVAHAPLTRDVETEVLVVGAGVSGALLAEALTAARLDVVIVDRRGPVSGSTAASTALLQHELDMPLTHLQRSLGREQATRVWLRSRLVVTALQERTQRLGIEAELAPRQALYLAGDVLNARGLAKEAAARRSIGLEVELLGRRELRERYGLGRSAALIGFGNWVAEPRKLAAGYLRVAVERGADIFAPVDVVQVREHARGVVATTSQGQRIRARHAVFATGYEVFKGLEARGHSLQSTWVIATKPQPRALWPSECMIWEASEPYLYLRTTSDGRVLCGGADEPFVDAQRRDASSARKFALLQRRLKRLLPQLDVEPAYAWAGTFGTSATGAPIIGRLPGKRRLYTVLGCGGNGITFSMLAAQLIRALVLGEQDRDAELFSPR
jgi:glycine/D-amino acid oxidase-like deaminating enzyme